jgi:peptidoglycan/LPS O-acetylase OafA/YrhL
LYFRKGGKLIMDRKSKALLVGIALVLVSIFVIYFNLKLVEESFKTLWPAPVLIAGIIFSVAGLKNRERIFLIFFGTFLAIASVPLFVISVSSFKTLRIIWPGFLFALGVGILSVYFYGKKKKITLAVSILILSISILIWVVYSLNSEYGLAIGVSLFILGAAFLTRGIGKENKELPEAESPNEKPSIIDDAPEEDVENE